ncbi:hypothetical protein BH23GEM6_BH23GEM6_23290 [soil metagenome]
MQRRNGFSAQMRSFFGCGRRIDGDGLTGYRCDALSLTRAVVERPVVVN